MGMLANARKHCNRIWGLWSWHKEEDNETSADLQPSAQTHIRLKFSSRR